MRILVCHNHYSRSSASGETTVMNAEVRLLAERGHEVRTYERTNREIDGKSALTKIRALKAMNWSHASHAAVSDVLREFQPDVMHVHNYKFVLTPSVFQAARDHGVRTVLTLHNFRLVCPGSMFLRDGRPCERCLDGRPYRVLWHRCYHNSLPASFLELHGYLGARRRGMLASWVDGYIALSEFAKRKFIEGGLPESSVFVKPNFMEDPLDANEPPKPGTGAIFIGRLSPEKGLRTLIEAWREIDFPLTIVGEGPEEQACRHLASDRVRWLGNQPHQRVVDLLKEAAVLVFPSTWYEGFPMTVLEAMACGRPVVATDLGPRREVVADGETGSLFRAGDADDLRDKVLALLTSPEQMATLGRNARARYRERYTPERNYDQLMRIYHTVMDKQAP